MVGKAILMSPIIAYLNDGRSCSPYSRSRPLETLNEPCDQASFALEPTKPDSWKSV